MFILVLLIISQICTSLGYQDYIKNGTLIKIQEISSGKYLNHQIQLQNYKSQYDVDFKFFLLRKSQDDYLIYSVKTKDQCYIQNKLYSTIGNCTNYSGEPYLQLSYNNFFTINGVWNGKVHYLNSYNNSSYLSSQLDNLSNFKIEVLGCQQGFENCQAVCDNREYFDEYRCVQCPQQCSSCENSERCKTCADGYLATFDYTCIDARQLIQPNIAYTIIHKSSQNVLSIDIQSTLQFMPQRPIIQTQQQFILEDSNGFVRIKPLGSQQYCKYFYENTLQCSDALSTEQNQWILDCQQTNSLDNCNLIDLSNGKSIGYNDQNQRLTLFSYPYQINSYNLALVQGNYIDL